MTRDQIRIEVNRLKARIERKQEEINALDYDIKRIQENCSHQNKESTNDWHAPKIICQDCQAEVKA